MGNSFTSIQQPCSYCYLWRFLSPLCKSSRDTKFLGIFISFPLWRPRSTRYSRWCIFSLESSKLYGHHTLHPVLQRLTYKLNMLFENGVQGSDGRVFKYAVTEIRGDWEWHKQLFNLSSTWKGVKNVCFRCNCSSRSDNPKNLYYCLDDDPDWKEFTLSEFLATQIKHDAPTCLSFAKFGQILLNLCSALFLNFKFGDGNTCCSLRRPFGFCKVH